jgi:hypothetical protein
VLDERIGFELGKNLDLKYSGIDEVVENKVDNPVLASKIDGGFGPVVGKRVQPGPFAPGHDHAKHIRIAYG